MKKLNDVFSEIKTPDLWKDNLYDAAYSEKKKTSRGFFKKFTIAVAAVLAVSACTITVGAITGVIDIPFFKDEVEVYKGGFKDEVSAQKIEEGKYQEINEIIETENATIKATKFLGDYVECYTVFEVRLKNNIKADTLTMEIMGLDENITDVENYLGDVLKSVPATNEETGETVYYFNVKNYEAHVTTTIFENRNIVYYIDSLCYTIGEETHEEVNETLTLKFNPDESVLTEVHYDNIDKDINVNGVDLEVSNTAFSDYRVQIELKYSIPKEQEPEWDNGLVLYNKIFGIAENGEFSVENANMKLKADGVEIDYIEPDFNGFFSPCNMTQNYADFEKPMGDFIATLRFERFDYENAKSIVLEITEADGNVISVDLK